MQITAVFHSSIFQYVSLIVVLIIVGFLTRQYAVPLHLLSFDPSTSSSLTIADCVDLNLVTNDSIQCVQTKLLLNQFRTMVCVYEASKDRDVSGLLISNGIWEEELVQRFVRILTTNRQYAFFDIGANVGIYTMYAASAGCSNVISIECFQPNIERIRRAVQLAHVQERVVLVPRALYTKSNVHMSLRANIQNNIGSQRLTNETSANEHDPLVVRTFRFDELLLIVRQRNIREAIIKIDIELSEHFLCETGSVMFDRINIPFVMMEWANIKSIPTRADLIQSFFTQRQYTPFSPSTCTAELEKDYRRWNSQDIIWIKRNYEHLCQS